jgi:hypothetical protein
MMSAAQPKPPSQRAGVIVTSVFVVLFGGIAALFLSVAMNDVEKEARIASASVAATATVVDVEKVCTYADVETCSFVPTVEFDVDGSTVKMELDSVGGKDTHRVGEQFSVTYQAGSPSTAMESRRLGEAQNGFILPSVFAAIGLAFAVFGCVNWVTFRRRFRAAQRSVSE